MARSFHHSALRLRMRQLWNPHPFHPCRGYDSAGALGYLNDLWSWKLPQ